MNETRSTSSRAILPVIHTLAQLLERLEYSKVPVGAEQYRSVVTRLANALEDIEPNASLRALLDAHPAAAELYENMNYQHAGLCRAPLDVSLSTESRAKDAIARAMRSARAAASKD